MQTIEQNTNTSVKALDKSEALDSVAAKAKQVEVNQNIFEKATVEAVEKKKKKKWWKRLVLFIVFRCLCCCLKKKKKGKKGKKKKLSYS